MKKIFLILAAVATLTACSNDSVRENIAAEQIEIDFSTYTQKSVGTKADATTVGLNTFHDNFVVYGYKNVDNTLDNEPVFNATLGQTVSYNDGSWIYSPKKFWDKSAGEATANGYFFYAAAPATGWNYADGAFSRSVELKGTSLAVSNEIGSNAKFTDDVDLMLAEDVSNYKNFTSAAVNLTFSHILSRLNIAVKSDGIEDGVSMKLTSLKVYNIVNKAEFKENATPRWDLGTTSATATLTFAEETVGNGVAIATDYKYVYRGLIVPQTVIYDVEMPLNGSGATDYDNAYIEIKYAITTSTTDASGAIVESTENFKAYYNLADIFNAAETDNVEFREGYQNNLYINIGAAAINFDAKAYVWDDFKENNFDIEESIKEQN